MSALQVGAPVTDLVPGNAADLERLVAHCRAVAEGLGGAAGRVRAIDSGEWVGPAGDAFRAVVDVEPGRYDDAAAAFAATAGAVRAYLAVLHDAQASARVAVTTYEQGDEARAEVLLAAAQQRVLDTGTAAVRTVAAAWEDAPREPHWWEKAGHFVAEIGRGAWEATTGLVEFAWSVSTLRMLVDPDGWSEDMQGLAKGLVYGVQHPVELGKALVDWDTWQESPGRAIGHLVPDLLLTLATAGGGAAARGARGVEALDEVADVATTFQRLDRLGESGERLSYFRRARNVLSGEHLPPPNLAADSPAGRAAAWQGTSTYPGTDRWFNARLMPGDEIGAGSLSFDRKRPFSGFAVPRPVLDEVGTDARRLYEGVQVGPWEGTYRDEVTVLRATRETDVAVSYAFANTDYGAGGLGQVFVPDMQKLVDDGVLEVLERRSMENTIARLCRPVASR